MGSLIQEVVGKLIDADDEEEEKMGGGGAGGSQRGLSVTGSPHWGVIEWLALQLGALLEGNSDEAQRLNKDLLKAQSTTYELKLQRVRSAAVSMSHVVDRAESHAARTHTHSTPSTPSAPSSDPHVGSGPWKAREGASAMTTFDTLLDSLVSPHTYTHLQFTHPPILLRPQPPRTTNPPSQERELQNAEKQIEAKFNTMFEERVRTLKGEGGKELFDALRKIDDLKEENESLGLKSKGAEEALTMAQQLLRSTERKLDNSDASLADEQKKRAAREGEMAACKAVIEEAMAEVGGRLASFMSSSSAGDHKVVPRSRANEQSSTEDRLKALLVAQAKVREMEEEANEGRRSELDAAKTEVCAARAVKRAETLL